MLKMKNGHVMIVSLNGRSNTMIKLSRIPDVVRVAVESGEIDVDTAVRATGAKKFIKGVTSEDKGPDVLDLAKKMTSIYKLNPGELEQESTEELDNEYQTTERLILDLGSSEMERLTAYSKEKGMTMREAAAELIENFLGKQEPGVDIVVDGDDDETS